MKLVSDEIKDYLNSSYYIDYNNEMIKAVVEKIKKISVDEVDFVKSAYEFVRDDIKHSWDVQNPIITIKASDVLIERVGICYSKANLLAALLRANNIPTGICYQRLTLGENDSQGYCIHALNAVYISLLDRWIRLDARGNNERIQAKFSLEQERLAFKVRKQYQEIDYQEIFCEPASLTMNTLERNNNALDMCLNDLPEYLLKD